MEKVLPALTDRQREVLDYVREFIIANRFAPTAAEIALRFKFASRTASINHLLALERKGRITRMAGHGRTITLVAVDEETRTLK